MPVIMTVEPPDFRLYWSNALDVLAQLLASELRTAAPGASLLEPDTVLIPQPAMRRWLQATLAERHGVVANIRFLAPGEFVREVLDANVAGASDDLDTSALHWRLYAALHDDALLSRPALAQIARHLDDGTESPRNRDALKAWTLAGELAAVFEKYQAWRREWLLRWEAGADPDDPQALLWRAVASGKSYRARRIQQYLDRFEGAGKPLPQGLPSRLFAFATLNVSPDVLRVIATQARVGTTHFYMPTPTEKYWGDLPSLRQRLREGEGDPLAAASGDNRLLQAWGAAGRDFVAVLGSYEIVHPSGEIPAYADPQDRAGPALADGGLSDSLLRRLQSDLFHRLPPPAITPTPDDARALLPAPRLDDPSLQIHACHTPLRELQVLHDRLRALLEDERFQPPLQPRDIAVLAPDIDRYAPYIQAVFGAGADAERIPYALADTSPLAAEPLAEVFIRLLALPISRFGLSEILDLLSSPPIAESAGLDAPALERLRVWLHDAGARWALDARHRVQHDAPADDACTWQFALDRLLLGYATGAEDDIVLDDERRVAPMPRLEGSSLDVLDTLVRLLRVLALQQRVLSEAMSPDAWRERLLALLAALVPDRPGDGNGQRALERLRALIQAFADQARAAGVDQPVPADVVRHHFATVLAEADTRAPLLSGGISFGRMVPMRLLPFRVICVLGMNDGDYPRRDPGAGLNRLTAAIAAGQRRPGDRSLREDDRFLFLQLFAAAQDVFYLSYIGADPADGSVREPSVLVSELLDEAARQHADPRAAAKALVLHHPLQPFAPGAFGSPSEPRHFSYRRQWHPAAGAFAGTRHPLPPWFTAPLAPMPAEAGTVVTLDQLRRFLLAPAAFFLEQRLGVRSADVDVVADDREPLLLPSHGLERHALQHAVFDAVLQDDDRTQMYSRLRARALLPSGAIGRVGVDTERAALEAYARAFNAWRGDDVPASPWLQVAIGDTVLQGRLRGVYPHGIARLRFGAPSGPSVIRDGLDWLFASAAGLDLPLVQFHDAGEQGAGPHVRPALDPERARTVLADLLALRLRGLSEPLPFAPYSGWALMNGSSLEAGMSDAAKQWHGGRFKFAEGGSDAVRLALRGHDPFADRVARRNFVELSFAIFAAVNDGRRFEGLDAETADELDQLPGYDVEDAE